jgi:hypothetical protein
MLAAFRADQKFDCTRIHIVGRTGESERVVEEALPKTGLQSGCWGNLDHLLVAKLDGTIALVEVNEITVGVSQNLHLDMTGARDQLFDKHGTVAKRGEGLTLATGERRSHLIRPCDGAHAATTTARGRFQHDRIADRGGNRDRFGGVRYGEGAACNNRDAERARQGASLGFVAKQPQRLWARTDKGNSVFKTSFREGGILREKTIAGMHAIAAISLGGFDQFLDVEIRAHRIALLRDAECVRRGSDARVERKRVDRGVYADRLHA